MYMCPVWQWYFEVQKFHLKDKSRDWHLICFGYLCGFCFEDLKILWWRLTDWQNADVERVCSLFGDCQDWQETDSPPTLNSNRTDCLDSFSNSLENCSRISCIRLKFSREFSVYIADMRKTTANFWSKCCQSCQSLKDCQQTANALHIGVLSVWQS